MLGALAPAFMTYIINEHDASELGIGAWLPHARSSCSCSYKEHDAPELGRSMAPHARAFLVLLSCKMLTLCC